MSNTYLETESAVVSLKNESTRQRWEMFHRAIAHAKQVNSAALIETDGPSTDTESSVPPLSIVR